MGTLVCGYFSNILNTGKSVSVLKIKRKEAAEGPLSVSTTVSLGVWFPASLTGLFSQTRSAPCGASVPFVPSCLSSANVPYFTPVHSQLIVSD